MKRRLERSDSQMLPVQESGGAEVPAIAGGHSLVEQGDPDQPAQGEERRCRQPFEVYRRGRQKGLDSHVLQSAPDGAGKSVPGLGFAMIAF